MTLQEKIDKLPLSIEHHRKTFVLRFGGTQEYIFIEYFHVNRFGDYHNIVCIVNENTDMAFSQRLEDVVDRALTIIENKEYV